MSPDGTTLLVAILSSTGIATIVAAVINARSSKKKLGAEATEAIQRAATGVVADIERQRDYATAELERARTEHRLAMADLIKSHTEAMARLEAQHAEDHKHWEDTLQLHVAWDWIAIAKVAELGVELPDPPPILPRNR